MPAETAVTTEDADLAENCREIDGRKIRLWMLLPDKEFGTGDCGASSAQARTG